MYHKHLIFFLSIRFHSLRRQGFPQNIYPNYIDPRRSSHDNKAVEPPDWNDPENYHNKIAQIIEYETSAEVHLPGTHEYQRRRVRNGTCSDIHPDMIVVPRVDEDVSKIVQISTIVGVPISVTSEGRSYNLCKSVKPG